MSLQAGTLVRVEAGDGSGAVALKGELTVFGLIAADILVMKRPKIIGKQWPFIVRAKSEGKWHEIGQAKMERKNPKTDYYLRLVIETPRIQKELDGSLWVNAFIDEKGKATGEDFADSYSLVYGSGGKKKSAPNDKGVVLDDEIPF